MIRTKLKYTFEIMELDDALIAVPIGIGANEFHSVIKLNETAAFIFDLLQEEIKEEQIIDALSREYDAPREEIASDVRGYLKSFREHGVLA